MIKQAWHLVQILTESHMGHGWVAKPATMMHFHMCRRVESIADAISWILLSDLWIRWVQQRRSRKIGWELRVTPQCCWSSEAHVTDWIVGRMSWARMESEGRTDIWEVQGEDLKNWLKEKGVWTWLTAWSVSSWTPSLTPKKLVTLPPPPVVDSNFFWSPVPLFILFAGASFFWEVRARTKICAVFGVVRVFLFNPKVGF